MKEEPPLNPWKTLSSKRIYRNPWIVVDEHEVINPGGSRGIYGKVHFNNEAIGIVPIDTNGETWLVGQYRYALNAYSWEIPEGGCPAGTDPLLSAKRELKEETGLQAEKWELLMRIHTSNSVTDEQGFIFMAEQLTEGVQELEATEADLIIKKIPLIKALQMITEGVITDSLTIAGLLMVGRRLGI